MHFKTGDLIYVVTKNSIGFIIDQGADPDGDPWYRTDVDGIRGGHELAKIVKPGGILNLIMDHGDIAIPPSIKRLINKHFGVELFDNRLLSQKLN